MKVRMAPKHFFECLPDHVKVVGSSWRANPADYDAIVRFCSQLRPPLIEFLDLQCVRNNGTVGVEGSYILSGQFVVRGYGIHVSKNLIEFIRIPFSYPYGVNKIVNDAGIPS